MCGARVVLAHFNTLLAVVGGAALVACVVISQGYVRERAAAVPSASVLVTSAYVCAPLLLALSHLCVSALHAAPRTARVLLHLYSATCTLTALAAVGVAGWSGYAVYQWLRYDEDAATILRHYDFTGQKRAWLQPFMPFGAEDIKSLLSEEDIHVEVVLVLVVCGLTLLVLLTNAVLALAARPRRPLRDDEHELRRCSSVYYEPSAPAYKTPLGDPARWQ